MPVFLCSQSDNRISSTSFHSVMPFAAPQGGCFKVTKSRVKSLNPKTPSHSGAVDRAVIAFARQPLGVPSLFVRSSDAHPSVATDGDLLGLLALIRSRTF